MDTQKAAPSQAQPDKAPDPAREQVDIAALTAAVERLLRRDLQLSRERLRGGALRRTRR